MRVAYILEARIKEHRPHHRLHPHRPENLDSPLARQLDLVGFPHRGGVGTGKQDHDTAIAVHRRLQHGAVDGLRFLHSFAGPPDRWDGLAAAPTDMGAVCDECDIFQGEAGNPRGKPCGNRSPPMSTRAPTMEGRRAAMQRFH